jgi:hypothetical protein
VWARGTDATSHLRRVANKLERQRLKADGAVEQCLAALLHLPLTIPRIAIFLSRRGFETRAAYGVSYFRQALQLMRCSYRYGLSPLVYYYLHLHRYPAHPRWREVIDPSELHYLQHATAPAHVDVIEDKLLFTRHAELHALPIIPVLGVWVDGAMESPSTDVLATLQRDIFVKRARSYSSQGVRGFSYDASTQRFRDTERSYSGSELMIELQTSSRNFTLLAQPWLRNHPDISGFSTGALCNYRIVTGRYPDGRIVIVLAILRFPIESELTCAERDTTLCAAVDLETGRLHAAETKRADLGQVTRHPKTGQPIEGFVVPRWEEIKATAIAAHATLPEFPFIGWDLCDTNEGIRVLEGGFLWGGYLAQLGGSLPLGATPFASIQTSLLARGEQAAALTPCVTFANS